MLRRLYLWAIRGIDGRLRYEPVIQELRRAENRQAKVLEVGCGPHGLTQYLWRPVTGYDVEYWGPDQGMLQRVQGKPGEALPFADRSFDLVVSADALEHIPADERPGFLAELVRVTGKTLILCCPCGAQALEMDRKLVALCEQRGVDQRWAAEHLELGLPEAETVMALIRERADPGDQLVLTGQVQVSTWLACWRFTLRRSKLLNALCNRVALLALPWLRRRNGEPCYRQCFTLRRRPR